MKQFRAIVSVIVGAAMLLVSASVFADDSKKLEKATNTVNNVRRADPPKVSNTQKPSPVGQKASEYKPKQKSPESKKIVVPPPGK